MSNAAVAIKKIKVGEMKDGLDMTALREVKFLQELHHPNIIGVSVCKAEPAAILCLPVAYCHHRLAKCRADAQLLDVFSVKQNVNLVLEFLDTDLEAVIRDKTLIFQPADIKSWMAMGFRGLEYIHRHGVLHRVSRPSLDLPCPTLSSSVIDCFQPHPTLVRLVANSRI